MMTGGCDEDASVSGLILGFPYWIAVRRKRGLDDPFFAAGNIERELIAKQVALDVTEDERHQIHKMEDTTSRGLICPIVGCSARLNGLDDFENHYQARHTATCSKCSRVYPTSRLLNIHLSEVHDSYFRAKVERGFPMYECLVEGCGVKLKSYISRKQHLVDKHKFPSSFEFYKKGRLSKHPHQKYQRKPNVNNAGRPDLVPDLEHVREEERSEPEMEIDNMSDIVAAASKLAISDSTPSSVSFGHRRSRGFLYRPRSIRQPEDRKD